MKKRKRLLFASVMVVITLLNCCYIRFALTADLVSDALTIVSIVYGLAVTAICNLYGRKITRKMWHTASHKNESQSQLHDLIDDFSSLFWMLGLLAVMSIVFYVLIFRILQAFRGCRGSKTTKLFMSIAVCI